MWMLVENSRGFGVFELAQKLRKKLAKYREVGFEPTILDVLACPG
jgi:hypothetical protein